MAKKKTIRTIPQERTPMREQPASVRVKNFAEVACGFTLEDALRESERCLLCPEQPCVEGCTVGNSLEPVAVGRLERWVGDQAIAAGWANIPYIEPAPYKVGIVGSGPAGM